MDEINWMQQNINAAQDATETLQGNVETLKERGYSEEQIRNMTPDQHDELANKIRIENDNNALVANGLDPDTMTPEQRNQALYNLQPDAASPIPALLGALGSVGGFLAGAVGLSLGNGTGSSPTSPANNANAEPLVGRRREDEEGGETKRAGNTLPPNDPLKIPVKQKPLAKPIILVDKLSPKPPKTEQLPKKNISPESSKPDTSNGSLADKLFRAGKSKLEFGLKVADALVFGNLSADPIRREGNLPSSKYEAKYDSSLERTESGKKLLSEQAKVFGQIEKIVNTPEYKKLLDVKTENLSKQIRLNQEIKSLIKDGYTPKSAEVTKKQNELKEVNTVLTKVKKDLKPKELVKAEAELTRVNTAIEKAAVDYKTLPTETKVIVKEANSRANYARFMNLSPSEAVKRDAMWTKEIAIRDGEGKKWQELTANKNDAIKKYNALEKDNVKLIKERTTLDEKISKAKASYTEQLGKLKKLESAVPQNSGSIAKAKESLMKLQAAHTDLSTQSNELKKREKTMDDALKNAKKEKTKSESETYAQWEKTQQIVNKMNGLKGDESISLLNKLYGDKISKIEDVIETKRKEQDMLALVKVKDIPKYEKLEADIKALKTKIDQITKEKDTEIQVISDKYKSSPVIVGKTTNDYVPEKLSSYVDPEKVIEKASIANLKYINETLYPKDNPLVYERRGNQLILENGVINLGTTPANQHTGYNTDTEKVKVLIVSDSKESPLSGKDNPNLDYSSENYRYEYIQNGGNTCQSYTLLEQMLQAGVRFRDSGRKLIHELTKIQFEKNLTAEMSSNTWSAYDKILEPYDLKARTISDSRGKDTTLEDKHNAIKEQLRKGKIVNSGMKLDALPAPPKYDKNGDEIEPHKGHRVNIVGFDDARGEWIVNDSNKEGELTRYPYGDYELGNHWSNVLEKR